MRLEFLIMSFIIISSNSGHTLPKRTKRLSPFEHMESEETPPSSAPLRPISCRDHKSRDSGIALQAAKEAKRANDDMAMAVKAAADRIKQQYAEKAATAAKAAEAVLSAKLQVLGQLEMEVREAEILVQDENQELSAVEANSQLSLKAHQQAKDEMKLLQAALLLAKDNCASAEQVSSSCQQSIADKNTLLETAQNRVNLLLRQLSEARIDYAKTKKAAYAALSAANEAKQRANRNNCNFKS